MERRATTEVSRIQMIELNPLHKDSDTLNLTRQIILSKIHHRKSITTNMLMSRTLLPLETVQKANSIRREGRIKMIKANKTVL